MGKQAPGAGWQSEDSCFELIGRLSAEIHGFAAVFVRNDWRTPRSPDYNEA